VSKKSLKKLKRKSLFNILATIVKTRLIKMSGDQVLISDLSMLCGKYEMMTIDNINKTYDMLAELDDVKNDEELSEVVNRFKASYRDIEESMNNYFKLLKKMGGNPKHCSLVDELENGLYCLDEKYRAITNIVEQYSSA
jgi:DNA repair ATPase RecN